MAYNLGQLVTDVRNKLDDTSFDSTLLKEFINDAQRYLTNKHQWRFMEGNYQQVTVADDFDYTLNADVETVETLRYTAPDNEEKDLTGDYIEPSEFDYKYPDPAADNSGKPHTWTIKEGELLLYPKPDAVYTLDIRYQKLPTELSADIDVPDVPERFKELLVLGALVRAHKFNDDYDLAQEEQSYMDEQVLDAVANTYTRQSRPTIMRVNGRRA